MQKNKWKSKQVRKNQIITIWIVNNNTVHKNLRKKINIQQRKLRIKTYRRIEIMSMWR